MSKQVREKIEQYKTLLSRKYPDGVNYDTLFDELTDYIIRVFEGTGIR